LTLEATDNGKPPLTGETTLTINVVGLGERMEFIGAPYSLAINYTVPLGAQIFTVSCFNFID